MLSIPLDSVCSLFLAVGSSLQVATALSGGLGGLNTTEVYSVLIDFCLRAIVTLVSDCCYIDGLEVCRLSVGSNADG